MSVSGRILQAADDLAPLKELAEIIKDPQKIVEAHEIARAQQALTEEVQHKAEEARNFIAKHADLLKEFEAKEGALAVKAEKLAKDISNFISEKEQQSAIYVEQSKVIAAGNEALRDARQVFEDERKKLKEETATLAREKGEIMERIRKEKDEIAAGRTFLSEERGRLDTYSNQLKSKAAKLQEIAGA